MAVNSIDAAISPFNGNKKDQQGVAIYYEMIVSVEKNAARFTKNPKQFARFKKYFGGGAEIDHNQFLPTLLFITDQGGKLPPTRDPTKDYYLVKMRSGADYVQSNVNEFISSKKAFKTFSAKIEGFVVYTFPNRFPTGIKNQKPTNKPAESVELFRTNQTLDNLYVILN